MNIKDLYKTQGWIGPIEIMDRDSALRYKDEILSWDKKLDLMNSDYRCKSNVLFPFVDEISRNDKLVKTIEQIIGSDFHCWDTLFWIKKPGDGKDVSFHQDATYWNFDNPELALTVWFAFDDVTQEHGSIEYIQGSHSYKAIKHEDIKTNTNLLMRGQTVEKQIPKERIVTSVPAGNVLIHSPFIIHGSGSNKTTTARVAMGMIFASTKCKPRLTLSPESTIMISGQDEYNYMEHDPRPTGNWEKDVINWKKAYDRQHINYYEIDQRAMAA